MIVEILKWSAFPVGVLALCWALTFLPQPAVKTKNWRI